jgi:hypothetical protein
MAGFKGWNEHIAAKRRVRLLERVNALSCGSSLRIMNFVFIQAF